MPLALLAALLGSLLIHGLILVGDLIALPGEANEPLPLRAELRPSVALQPVMPAKPAAPAPAPVNKQPPESPKPVPAMPTPSLPTSESPPPAPVMSAAEVAAPRLLSAKPLNTSVFVESPAEAVPDLPAAGVIRFAIFRVSMDFQVGRAEHRWQFNDDGHYILRGLTETSGLVSLFRPLRQELISRGRLTQFGLQPMHFQSLRNGQETGENADFDWSTSTVTLQRDGSVQALLLGTQDVLSLNYQLAYLPHPEAGSQIGVVTGKKYETYSLDSLGEEWVETPAGRFRTLHLRAQTSTVTEIWMALDHYRLPVKIRFTDRKGDQYEQLATEIGTE